MRRGSSPGSKVRRDPRGEKSNVERWVVKANWLSGGHNTDEGEKTAADIDTPRRRNLISRLTGTTNPSKPTTFFALCRLTFPKVGGGSGERARGELGSSSGQ